MSVAFAPARVSLARSACARPSVAAHAKAGNWLPGADSPAYLDGSKAGDYGFDPLGLVRNVDPPRSRSTLEAPREQDAAQIPSFNVYMSIGRACGFGVCLRWALDLR